MADGTQTAPYSSQTETETGPTWPAPRPRTGPDHSEPSPSPRPSTASHGPELSDDATILATVEVNPRYTAPNTPLWVSVNRDGTRLNISPEVGFGPTNSRRDVSIPGTWSVGDLTIALLSDEGHDPLPTPWRSPAWRSAPSTTPDPPTGLEATRGDGEVTLSWATDSERPPPSRRATSTGRGGNRVPMGAGRTLWETSS